MFNNIEFSKYKRFFSFGCSFTKYHWATWADIIHKEMPDAEFHNFGQGGAGNLMISARIAEANTKYKFNETDLVAVMYTTFTREDRWLNGNWVCLGNIFNQDFYPRSWVEKFADETGYLIRDTALIELSSEYLRNLPCGSILMASKPLEESFEGPTKINPKGVLDIYSHLKDKVYTLTDLEKDISSQNCGHRYVMDGKMHHDGHPRPIQYFNYLAQAGINLTDKARLFAQEQEQRLLSCRTYDEIRERVWPQLIQPAQQLF